jgi:hypothetical protein
MDAKSRMQDTWGRMRQLNFDRCWNDPARWPLVNRHLWRICAMYYGAPWSNVDPVEECLSLSANRKTT